MSHISRTTAVRLSLVRMLEKAISQVGRLNSTTRVISKAGKSIYPILKHTLVSSFMRAECRTQAMH